MFSDGICLRSLEYHILQTDPEYRLLDRAPRWNCATVSSRDSTGTSTGCPRHSDTTVVRGRVTVVGWGKVSVEITVVQADWVTVTGT